MSWIILVIAGLLEVVWAVGLKYTHGFSRLTPSVITVTAMIVSLALLAWAMKSLPVGRLMPCGRVLAQSARPSPALCCSVSPLTRCAWRVWR